MLIYTSFSRMDFEQKTDILDTRLFLFSVKREFRKSTECWFESGPWIISQTLYE